MLFKSSIHLLIYSSVVFILSKSLSSYKSFSKRAITNYEPKCRNQITPVDQIVFFPNQTQQQSRRKRFVLFPEFENYLNDWRYINRPEEIFYWISNFYPNRINTDYLHHYIKHIIQQINTVVDHDIVIHSAADPGEANFQFIFFDYTRCPMDDTLEAIVDNVKVLDELYIYPVDVTRESRYRAHGGIQLVENDRPISTIKFNMQQTFLYSEDLVYDPLIYTCIEDKNECEIDLYYVLLHETLHGFGIEHTVNAKQPILPNANMKAVMYNSNFRIMCHDDIRAIRMVYRLSVKRDNAQYDDTCRRDFPMNKLQKLMYRTGVIITILFITSAIVSTITWVLTLLYLLIRYLWKPKSQQFEKQTKTISTKPWIIQNKKPMIKTKHSVKPRGYLWHDDLV